MTPSADQLFNEGKSVVHNHEIPPKGTRFMLSDHGVRELGDDFNEGDVFRSTGYNNGSLLEFEAGGQTILVDKYEDVFDEMVEHNDVRGLLRLWRKRWC